MRNVQVREQWKRASRFGVGGISQLLKILLSCVLLFLSIPLTIAQDNSKNVLMLFSSFGRDIAWPNKICSGADCLLQSLHRRTGREWGE